MVTGRPVTAATASAVWTVRRSGDATMASMRAEASRLAAAAACVRPASVSGTSVRPAYRFCTDIGVWPCRSSRVVAGSLWAGIQADLART